MNRPTIAIIAAMTAQRVMGDGLKLPWHIPEDWAHFKRTTIHKPVIMGRKTFDSINCKPLPHRTNIVMSSTLAAGEGYKVARSVAEALAIATEAIIDDPAEIMIIGGAQIYADFLPITDKMYLSMIHKEYAGDILFPTYDPMEWKLVSETVSVEFTLKILQRKFDA